MVEMNCINNWRGYEDRCLGRESDEVDDETITNKKLSFLTFSFEYLSTNLAQTT